MLSAETGAEVESEFVAQYTQSLDSTMNSMQIFFFLAITALALGWVYLSWTHMRREQPPDEPPSQRTALPESSRQIT